MLKAVLLFPVQLVWQWLKSPIIATRKAWNKTIGAAKKTAAEKDREVWFRGRLGRNNDKPVFVGPGGANFKRRRRGHRGGKKHRHNHERNEHK